MDEWTTQYWHMQITEHDTVALYLYTPMCGTCAVASKMMTVVEEVVPNIPIGKMNLNYAESLAKQFEIESVPCLIIAQNGQVTDKIYAFQSVLHVYEHITNHNKLEE